MSMLILRPMRWMPWMVVARRTTAGGTGHEAVRGQLDQAKQRQTADTQALL